MISGINGARLDGVSSLLEILVTFFESFESFYSIGGREVRGRQGIKICTAMAAMALALTGFGCGSGSDSTSKPLTKAEFIKQGDEICREAAKKKEQKIATWKKENNDPVLSQRKQIENVIRTVALPPIREESEALAALGAPDADQKAADFVESFAKAVEDAEANPRIYVEGKVFTDTENLARKYGFKDCVST